MRNAMTQGELSERLAKLVCEALNGDIPPARIMASIMGVENNLAAFMLSADGAEFVADAQKGPH